MISPQTTADWMDELVRSSPQLKQMQWAYTKEGRIRNSSGQCPLCALADLKGSPTPGMKEAWAAALMRVYPDGSNFICASAITRAADQHSDKYASSLRRALKRILGLPS
jgi:hypothetical protein